MNFKDRGSGLCKIMTDICICKFLSFQLKEAGKSPAEMGSNFSMAAAKCQMQQRNVSVPFEFWSFEE